MRWMKVAGFVFIFGLVAACKIDAKTPNQCQADEQCPEGAYCDVGRALCVLACEKAGCLDGHFCDPDSHYCKDYCPHKCPIPPANATLLCGEVCVYACNDGFRECEGREGACLSDSSDPTACGATCEDLQVCTVPENGTATCSDGACGVACDAGSYDAGGTCATCNVTEHCGPSCNACTAPPNGTATCNGGACGVACNPGSHIDGATCAPNTETTCCGTSCFDCTENGTLTGMGCNGGVTCFQAERFSRNTSVPSQPTVRDRDTGFIWQGCPVGYMGNDCLTPTGGDTKKTWDAANSYCPTLTWGGFSGGWRLPSQHEGGSDELGSLLPLKYSCDLSGAIPQCIDATAFPNTPPLSRFWSSSICLEDSNFAWTIAFYYTEYQENISRRSSTNYVRCVR